MKFIHLSDLHLGKRLHEYSMIEDQEYILAQILDIIKEEAPQGIIIAGDVFDKAVPSTEAIRLLDDFLFALSQLEPEVFVISGNHDSPERLAFASRLIEQSGVHISPAYNGTLEPFELTDEYGSVFVYMLPFIKPANVRRFFEAEPINSYTEAVKTALESVDINTTGRNLLITHQFVTGAARCESEDISVGGTDNVDAGVFEKFDYVALGHIHSAQSIGRETLRYCGTPLKYSFSEAAQEKSVCIVELFEKGNVEIRLRKLTPLRDMLRLKGNYMELSSLSFHSKINKESFVHITLTDEQDIPDAAAKLRVVYPYLLSLDYDNARTRSLAALSVDEKADRKDPIDLFSEFYVKQNGGEMNEAQSEVVAELIKKIWGCEE